MLYLKAEHLLYLLQRESNIKMICPSHLRKLLNCFGPLSFCNGLSQSYQKMLDLVGLYPWILFFFNMEMVFLIFWQPTHSFMQKLRRVFVFCHSVSRLDGVKLILQFSFLIYKCISRLHSSPHSRFTKIEKLALWIRMSPSISEIRDETFNVKFWVCIDLELLFALI